MTQGEQDMYILNDRKPEAHVDCMFLDRWSPRAFEPVRLPRETVQSLFEAARWAPSCSNEQPWLFLYAQKETDKKKFASLLTSRNQEWAPRASLLVFVLAKKHFDYKNRENFHALFDCGAAWMALALQARKLGLFAHGMAGFDRDRSYKVLKVPEDRFTVVAAIAIGRYGDPELLSEYDKNREKPSMRKPLPEVALEGLFRE